MAFYDDSDDSGEENSDSYGTGPSDNQNTDVDVNTDGEVGNEDSINTCTCGEDEEEEPPGEEHINPETGRPFTARKSTGGKAPRKKLSEREPCPKHSPGASSHQNPPPAANSSTAVVSGSSLSAQGHAAHRPRSMPTTRRNKSFRKAPINARDRLAHRMTTHASYTEVGEQMNTVERYRTSIERSKGKIRDLKQEVKKEEAALRGLKRDLDNATEGLERKTDKFQKNVKLYNEHNSEEAEFDGCGLPIDQLHRGGNGPDRRDDGGSSGAGTGVQGQ